ncbi:MAG TPA: cob(I)yrinic acid a,c-diamide adenosyltransferase [Spirochaetia bacterium]|nr:cob(I)yrinic acid a,c-diamide adenosyltransferase [Spirochaetales bacterium]HPD80122.1 cob(I)yrinic acid a,c-diamide adenosyltransferase [Spirochaetales bacterium]HQK33764.1 cob(I)yrinic acid a,c-diamide adenosyltransferase [Spirochaetales bacterium]HRS64912.1 cob(I)yrinic acid a,c-diamide adenosyltransferase [Spirochaetia bacterium]HRV27519.1 cob(I)yrinic acid a,c-diamide adenosyltransferase [Spirochaetia bacterium]
MSISTTRGDDGTTSLWSGERVNKDDPRVEAYGTIDELNAVLTDALYAVERNDVKELINELCIKLHTAASMLASGDKKHPHPLTEQDVTMLTDIVHKYEAEVQLKGLVLLGKTQGAARLDIARTVARRAERRIVTLDRHENVDPVLKQFINRLSDVLFMLARAEELSQGVLTYKPRG